MSSFIVFLAAQATGVGVSPEPCALEGASFMQSYAAALKAGDRAGIAARYSDAGAFFNGFAPKTLDSRAAIEKFYVSGTWQKPDAFEWSDLSFEAVGADACLVTGAFRWTAAGQPADFAYTALLRRESGSWRIRLEHENPLPSDTSK